MSESTDEAKGKKKARSNKAPAALDPKTEAAANVLTRFRAFGMLIALGAAAWSGFQAASTSDLLGGAIRAAIVWGMIAGMVLAGARVMSVIITTTPPDAPVPEAPTAEALNQ